MLVRSGGVTSAFAGASAVAMTGHVCALSLSEPGRMMITVGRGGAGWPGSGFDVSGRFHIPAVKGSGNRRSAMNKPSIVYVRAYAGIHYWDRPRCRRSVLRGSTQAQRTFVPTGTAIRSSTVRRLDGAADDGRVLPTARPGRAGQLPEGRPRRKAEQCSGLDLSLPLITRSEERNER